MNYGALILADSARAEIENDPDGWQTAVARYGLVSRAVQLIKELVPLAHAALESRQSASDEIALRVLEFERAVINCHAEACRSELIRRENQTTQE